jgi:adenylate cyclase
MSSPPPTKAELVPVGGGDPIPLITSPLVIGRRESCDICLKFNNISGRHCELFLNEGVWYVRDLGSTNGTKVNGQPIQQEKLLRPDDEIAIANRRFRIRYTLPPGRGFLVEEEDIDVPLLEKAGLARPSRPSRPLPRLPLPDEETDQPDSEPPP